MTNNHVPQKYSIVLQRRPAESIIQVGKYAVTNNSVIVQYQEHRPNLAGV